MMYKLDNNGIPYFTEEGVFRLIYSGKIEILDKILCLEGTEVDLFNDFSTDISLNSINPDLVDYKKEEIDQVLRSSWIMPEEYKNIDVYAYLLEKADTEKEKSRIIEELDVYKSQNLLDLLRYMIYLVDVMKKNNIVWGVGRGSSVSSYVLFLIGVHRINPIKYGLDWKEFLK